jgi:hypothetical protein
VDVSQSSRPFLVGLYEDRLYRIAGLKILLGSPFSINGVDIQF